MKLRSNTYIKKTIYILAAFLIFAIVSFGFKMNAKADNKLVEINGTNFPDYNFRNYVMTNLETQRLNGKTYVSQDTFNSVRELNLDSKGGVEYTNLTGLNFFKNLEKLSCVQNTSLVTIDLTQNKQLKELYCYNTGIKSLNLRYNTYLEVLECQNCKLTSLDVTQNTKLKELNCRNNAITTLNVICNPELVELRCHQNKLTTLNLDNNTKLEYLTCNENNLTSLRFKNNTKLTQIFCGNNAITSLENLANCTKLELLDCSYNKLSTLDVNNNTKLTSLICRGNKLTYLSVKNSKNLAELICDGNNIENVVINEGGLLSDLRKNSTLQTNEYNKTKTRQSKSGDKIIIVDLNTNVQELPATITVVEMDETAIRALVTRMYYTMLKRDPETGAVDNWTNRLINKQVNGVELGKRFALSDEITKQRPVSDKEFVTRLYKTFLDRDGSEAEINSWVAVLNGGKTREYVLAGFVNSQEFDKFCKECGITRGNMTVQNPDKPKTNNNNNTNPSGLKPLKVDVSKVDDKQLTAFVERLYKKALGRSGEATGVTYWKGCILFGKDSDGREYDIRTVVSKGFFLSAEYTNKHTSNEQFVADCYAAFFNRDPRGTDDEVNYKNWVKQLNEGKLTRQQMIEHGFGDSPEFRNLIKSYGFVILN